MKIAADRYLAETLAAYEVSHLFHVPVVVPSAMREMTAVGATVPVMAHSEKAAAYMADGYARVSGKPGVCGSQTIGATNLASGLRDAYLARIPVIALTGGKQLHSQYRGQYQEIDDMPVFEALTKFNATVWKAARLPDLLEAAFRAATTGMPAPVHLELSGVMGEVASMGEIEAAPPANTRYARFPAIRPAAPAEEIAAAVELLGAAERPVLVVGGGARTSGAGAEVLELARRLAMPVATTLNAKGLVPEHDPLALGVVGEYSTTAANRAVCDADLVFYVGSQTGGLATRNWTVPGAEARVLHLDIEPQNIGRNYRHTVPLCGDARTVLRQLLEQLVDGRDHGEWLRRLDGYKHEWTEATAPEEASEALPMAPERLARELGEALPEDAILVGDTGHLAAWLAQNVHVESTGQAVIRAHGSLGWSFPAAVGAKSAAPDRPVVCFSGDGGFYYHLSELETALRYELPVVVVINDNAALSQEKELWDASTDWDHLWRMRPTDFAAVAEAFGCAGLRVERPGELADALDTALADGRPAVIDARTDEAKMAPPAWSPAGSVGMYDAVIED